MGWLKRIEYYERMKLVSFNSGSQKLGYSEEIVFNRIFKFLASFFMNTTVDDYQKKKELEGLKNLDEDERVIVEEA